MGLIPVLLTLKFWVYAAWCRVGLRWLGRPEPARPWAWALGLATARVLAGLGAGIALGALLMGGGGEEYGRLGLNPWAWLGGVAVIRWALWSAVAAQIQRSAAAWLVPTGRRDFAWRGLAWLGSLAGDGAALALGLALGGLPC